MDSNNTCDTVSTSTSYMAPGVMIILLVSVTEFTICELLYRLVFLSVWLSCVLEAKPFTP